MAGPAQHGEATAAVAPRRLSYYSGGFVTQPRLRRILTLAGHELRLARPAPGDGVVVWGHSPAARRGAAAAERHGLPLVRLEDAFLRSVHPGRSRGEAPHGLLLDPFGIHYDSRQPSALERILSTEPLDDGAVLQRAKDGMERLKLLSLSKYNNFDAAAQPPAPGYVLVIDQVRGDAAVALGGATEATFREMLVFAQEEHPGARIVIRPHPETLAGGRPGHFGSADVQGRVSLLTEAIPPAALLDGAIAVYTVSSLLGFEAILAGHRPRVFGQPFYAGWGLSADENPPPRRRRNLTRTQIFAGAMILAPLWYDPFRDRLASFEEAVDQLEAEVRAYREDRRGHVTAGMRLWKRPVLQTVFGREKPLIFENDPSRAVARARAAGRGLLIWAGREPEGLADDAGNLSVLRVEDGFLRSRGLGAELVPPVSLVADPDGIYYDPSRESRLELLIAAPLPAGGAARAARLALRIQRGGVTKYNTGAPPPADLPEGRRILVPGQVEDDASIRLGAGAERTNLALLARVRKENPAAVILYKPHPDVEAGLRPGAIPEAEALTLADRVLAGCDPAALIALADEVWTITSLLGFEALLRGKPVTCLGVPFYAGWGLTRDLGPVPARRRARPDLETLIHAALIAYPRYIDPVTRRPCPPEVAVDRLAHGAIPSPGAANRALAKLQGLLASGPKFWR